MTSSSSFSERSRTWALCVLPLLLLVLAALRPLALPDEGRYAEVGRWMLMSGDWLTPRLDGIPFFHKPPLLHWLEASAMAVLGVTPWASRLVVALHVFLMWALLWACARHIAGLAVANRAAWMLGSSLAFLMGGQYVNHDMMVATWMGVGIWCFARALMHADGVHAGWARAGFIACALAVLSKGLIGLLLPGFVLCLWVTWTWQWRKVWALPWFSGVLLFAAVALPWFVLAAREHPDMLAYMFGKHQFGRYTATTFNNARPWWFYGLAVTVLMFPWVFLVLASAWRSLRHRLTALNVGADVGVGADPRWTALCWIWLIAILGFFSIPNSKLIGYALPVVPPLALLAALWWQRHVTPRAWGERVFAIVVGLNVALAVGGHVAAERFTQKHSSMDVAAVLACQARPSDVVAAVDEYPYDLPFYAQVTRPLEVIQDWDTLRQTSGDNWRRELFEGADFDAQAGRSLVPLTRLESLKQTPRAWVVAPNTSGTLTAQNHAGFELVFAGRAWNLYQSNAVASGASASTSSASSASAKSPEAAEQKGLRGCKDQGKK
ncbi:glycosyltransferase family 39 protein [Limnohabitans sp. B9-3]|uniref:ArnT family glycosyltransferase n=1 Tax=Limnohabitans sp. B9-3 TaxID=1100707 RepID=UPI000C1DF79F|nr:glycosyltransferase family 39 protein [Limnohabitans sp. B9-3]PIT71719.1 phospholipid carrier-dependent glycosyltransferase [Limnohabitans sp. B9-3]